MPIGLAAVMNAVVMPACILSELAVNTFHI